VHEYIQVTCSPLGIGGGLVPTCNGAKNDMWPQGYLLLLEHFTLCKVLLSREVGLWFVHGLYTKGSRSVEGVLTLMMKMQTSQQQPLKLLRQWFSTFSRGDSVESIMIYAYLVQHFGLQAFPSVFSKETSHMLTNHVCVCCPMINILTTSQTSTWSLQPQCHSPRLLLPLHCPH
jgi:hypothetical protein